MPMKYEVSIGASIQSFEISYRLMSYRMGGWREPLQEITGDVL